MQKLIKFFIKYPTWSNAIMIAVILFGLIAVLNMRSSFFAELENNTIGINIFYPGASPEEIEQGVIQKIEDNLKGIRGIDRFTSKSQENQGNITVEVFRHENMDAVYQDVKNAVDRISAFPVDMEPVVVAKNPSTEFALSFGIKGKDDLKSLKTISRKIEDDLRNMKGISQITIGGFPEEEIVVYLDEESMRRYELSFDMVSRALSGANIDLTAGSIKTEKEEILIRMENKEYFAEDLLDVVIKTTQNGDIVKVSDIGEIRNTWAENPNRVYIDGELAVVINVNKLIGERFLEIAGQVKEYIKDFNEENDEYEAILLADFTNPLESRIDTLIENGGVGAILVILSLSLFLNWRIAIWVAVALPFSFLGMFLAGYMWGLTINVLSLFGCIVVVGILVDDGIIVAEQVYQKYENGMNPFKAAIQGTLEVLPSVFFAIATSIAMFMPFFFLEGNLGASLKDFGFVVIFTLLFSLLEAAVILPAHLAHSKAMQKENKPGKIRQFLEKLITVPRDNYYAKSLKFFLNRSGLVLVLIVFITVVTVGAISGRVIGFTFFPFIDSDSFDITIEMPAGTREGITDEVLLKIENAALEVNKELSAKRNDGKQVIKHIVRKVAQAGGSDGGPRASAGFGGNSHQGIVQIVLLDGEIRDLASFKISNAIREKVGPLYETEVAIFGSASIFGKPISYTFVSPDMQQLDNAKNTLKEYMKNMSEIADVSDNDPQGLREIDMKLKDKAYVLGLTELEIARQVRQGFFGAEVQRIQRGEDEVKVWVKYSDDYRSSIGNWEDMRIRTQSGGEYPLKELVDYEIKRGSIVINHIDGGREITVDADLVDQNADAPPVIAKIDSSIVSKILLENPSVRIVESGQARQIQMMQRSAQASLGIAFIVMFFLVALSFRSYQQALVVFSLIPLGIIGAMWGHAIYNISVNIMSIYGMIALIGIIVNDSIVYTNTYNEYLKEGKPVKKALFDAGINRYRPILLTTVTTVLGLLPLLQEKSVQAQFLIPMAISVAFGLMFASFFILVFLPSLLYILNSIKATGFRIWEGKWPKREQLETAIKEKNLIDTYSFSNGQETYREEEAK